MNISATTLASLELALAELERASRQVSVPNAPVDAVSLSNEAVAMISAKNRFEAGVSALKIADAMDAAAISVASTEKPSF